LIFGNILFTISKNIIYFTTNKTDIIFDKKPVLALLTTLFSCCSVMWSTKSNGIKNYRFIITGGTLMTIFGIIKSILVGTGGSGVCTK